MQYSNLNFFYLQNGIFFGTCIFSIVQDQIIIFIRANVKRALQNIFAYPLNTNIEKKTSVKKQKRPYSQLVSKWDVKKIQASKKVCI